MLGHLARNALGQGTLPVRELMVTIDATQIPPTDADGTELTGPARVHRWGTLLANRLPELLAGCKVIVRPVIDPSTLGAIDPHDPTPAMRLALDTRDPYCVGPYGATPAAACDADHTRRYIDGDTGQTRLPTLGNLSRFIHRAKTAGEVTTEQVSPGVFHWRYRSGYQFLVDNRGTTRLHTPQPVGPPPPTAPPVKPYADPPPEDPAWDHYPQHPTWLNTQDPLALTS